MTAFRLVQGREAATTLDAMLPHVTDENNLDFVAYPERAEEARRLARLRIKDHRLNDDQRDNLRREIVYGYVRPFIIADELKQSYAVIWGPYDIFGRLGQLYNNVVPDVMSASQRGRVRPDVVHVVCLKTYNAR